MVFLKEFFKKMILKKIGRQQKSCNISQKAKRYGLMISAGFKLGPDSREK